MPRERVEKQILVNELCRSSRHTQADSVNGSTGGALGVPCERLNQAAQRICAPKWQNTVEQRASRLQAPPHPTRQRSGRAARGALRICAIQQSNESAQGQQAQTRRGGG